MATALFAVLAVVATFWLRPKPVARVIAAAAAAAAVAAEGHP